MSGAAMLLLLPALWLAAPTPPAAEEPPPASFSDCTCATARLTDGFCPHCQVGWVAGVRITSKVLFEALDAHGHDIDVTMLGCEECVRAHATNGYCERSGIGWVNGLGYLSRLTYHLAKGERRDPQTIKCPVCRKNAASYGWCDKHRVGMIGPVAITNRQDYAVAAKAYRILLAANELVPQCELCAAALAANGRCPIHRIQYRDGEKVPQEAP